MKPTLEELKVLLEGMLVNPGHRLDLDKKEIDVVSLKSLAEQIQAQDAYKVCTRLYLSDNPGIGIDGAKQVVGILGLLPELISFTMMGAKIGDNGAKAIAGALSDGAKNLDTLYLSENDIGANGVSALASMLAENTKLDDFSLRKNNIGSVGAYLLASALEKNKHLHTLILTDNNIGESGAKKILKALEKNHTLTNINLEGNPKIQPETIAAINVLIERNRDEQESAAKEQITAQPPLYTPPQPAQPLSPSSSPISTLSSTSPSPSTMPPSPPPFPPPSTQQPLSQQDEILKRENAIKAIYEEAKKSFIDIMIRLSTDGKRLGKLVNQSQKDNRLERGYIDEIVKQQQLISTRLDTLHANIVKMSEIYQQRIDPNRAIEVLTLNRWLITNRKGQIDSVNKEIEELFDKIKIAEKSLEKTIQSRQTQQNTLPTLQMLPVGQPQAGGTVAMLSGLGLGTQQTKDIVKLQDLSAKDQNEFQAFSKLDLPAAVKNLNATVRDLLSAVNSPFTFHPALESKKLLLLKLENLAARGEMKDLMKETLSQQLSTLRKHVQEVKAEKINKDEFKTCLGKLQETTEFIDKQQHSEVSGEEVPPPAAPH